MSPFVRVSALHNHNKNALGRIERPFSRLRLLGPNSKLNAQSERASAFSLRFFIVYKPANRTNGTEAIKKMREGAGRLAATLALRLPR